LLLISRKQIITFICGVQTTSTPLVLNDVICKKRIKHCCSSLIIPSSLPYLSKNFILAATDFFKNKIPTPTDCSSDLRREMHIIERSHSRKNILQSDEASWFFFRVAREILFHFKKTEFHPHHESEI
jgi:hypothetical protein